MTALEVVTSIVGVGVGMTIIASRLFKEGQYGYAWAMMFMATVSITVLLFGYVFG